MNDDLARLGDQLDAAIGTPPPRRTAGWVAAVVVIGAAATFAIARPEPRAEALRATVVEQVPDPSSGGPAPAAPDAGDAFASAVFRHLPMAEDRAVTCTVGEAGRYRCEVADPIPVNGQQRFVFRDRARVTVGACEATGPSLTAWSCASDEVALRDGLLSSAEVRRLTEG